MNITTLAATPEQYKEIVTTIRNGFLTHRPNERIAFAVQLEAVTGMRVSDIVTMRPCDIVYENGRHRLNLAKRLTDADPVTRQEAAAKEAATAWTVERLNSIKDGYPFKQTGEGLYSGWTGCNNGDLYGQELKKANDRHPRAEDVTA